MATPFRIDQVASVTRKGCSRSTEMSRPLSAPTAKPSARIATRPDRDGRRVVAELRRGDHRAEADHAADRQVDAAAQQHDRLAGGGQHQRHRRGGVEVELVEREDAGLRASRRWRRARPASGRRRGTARGRAAARASRHRAAARSARSRRRSRSSSGRLVSSMAAREDVRPRRCARPRASRRCDRCAAPATRSATWTSSGRSLE